MFVWHLPYFFFFGGIMNLTLSFFITSIMLGVGLAMDAFSVSLVSGLSEPCMKYRKMTCVAGVFAFFQALMPMIGWLLVHTVLELFKSFEKYIPVIALVLLGYIGIKMIIEGLHCEGEDCKCRKLTLSALLIQGIATSIDALSVGLDIAEYDLLQALISALIIAAITFVICFFGIIIGKKTGTVLSGKANIFGGVILVLIGIYIFVSSLF